MYCIITAEKNKLTDTLFLFNLSILLKLQESPCLCQNIQHSSCSSNDLKRYILQLSGYLILCFSPSLFFFFWLVHLSVTKAKQSQKSKSQKESDICTQQDTARSSSVFVCFSVCPLFAWCLFCPFLSVSF